MRERDYHTIAEVAGYRGCSRATVQRAIHRGELRAERFGRQYLVRREDVENWRPFADRTATAANARESRRRAKISKLVTELGVGSPAFDVAISALSDSDREVLVLYLVEGRTFAEIGRSRGITASGAHHAFDVAVGRLRRSS